jgi:universal stress protein E
MDKIESLLIVIDPTVERDFVVNKAKEIAKLANAKVLFYINNANTLNKQSYIYEGIDGDFFETQRKLFEEHYRKLLDDLVTEFNSENIDASFEFSEQHNLAESIIDLTKKICPDLVIKSTHHHSALERTLITNTDWRLIRKCPAPLLLVKPDPWFNEGGAVVAVDPMHSNAQHSKLDESLISGLNMVAKKCEFTPCVFHSYYPFVSTMFPLGGETKEHMDNIRTQHLDKVRELIQGTPILEDNIRITEGDLVATLISYLKEVNANLLVVGALSKNVVERAIVGNTAERILEDCPCDVLVIKN